MGFGDEIMATAFAKIEKEKFPDRQIIIGDLNSRKATYSRIFENNPYISDPRNLDPDKIVHFVNHHPVNRPYFDHQKSTTKKYIWNYSYKALPGQLFFSDKEKILAKQSFLFGDRPSSADFGIFGQLTQLVNVDPTSRALAEKQSMRTVAWVDLMEDLSGISDNTPWMKPESVQPILNDLLIEIGKTYVPAMLANAEAISANQDTWSNQICGSDWSQKTFPYQAKCLNWVREEFNRLNQEDKDLAVSLLKDTGCENLFKE